jgi:hypothetical protein
VNITPHPNPNRAAAAASVVVRVIGIRKIKNYARVRLGTTTMGKLLAEVDGAIEAQTSVIVDVDVQRLEIRRSINNSDFASLHKVVYFKLTGSLMDIHKMVLTYP